MWGAASTWPNEQCHVHVQDPKRRNPAPPNGASELNHEAMGQPREVHLDPREAVRFFLEEGLHPPEHKANIEGNRWTPGSFLRSVPKLCM